MALLTVVHHWHLSRHRSSARSDDLSMRCLDATIAVPSVETHPARSTASAGHVASSHGKQPSLDDQQYAK